MLDESDKFKESSFSILCDRYPILNGKATYKAKVLYISFKNKSGEYKRLYYDKITEMNMNYIILTFNIGRRISSNQIELFDF